MTWVKLNVGGVSFETRLSTVTKYPNSYLASIFQSDQMQNCDSAQDGAFLLDCDPDCFAVVLIWLRYGELCQPVGCDRRLLGLTAALLGLHELTSLLDKELETVGSGGKGAMTDWIRLNVGGTMFETSRATLTSHPTSSLARMFEPNSNLPPAIVSADGVYQIDSCPKCFSVILNWLRLVGNSTWFTLSLSLV